MSELIENYSKHKFDRPLIHEGTARLLWDRTFGGPPEPDIGNVGDPVDRRLVLSSAELRELLKVAEQSLTGRVVIHHAGVRVRCLEEGGHRYESVRIVGGKVEPERVGF